MDKDRALNLIDDTLGKSFDINKYKQFTKELLNDYEEKEFNYSGQIIPDAFKGSINQYIRVGKYLDENDKQVDILAVKLSRESSLDRARTTQRNFITWYLNGGRGGLRDAALVAFYSDDRTDWRFSLIQMTYERVKVNGKWKNKKVLSPAKRYSFLVGENEPSHTAKQFLLPLLENSNDNPTLEEIENSFNVEKVTSEFYEKYKELVLSIKEYLDKELKDNDTLKKEFSTKKIESIDFSKKLMGQIIFLYFLQKKGWLGIPENGEWGKGDKNFIDNLYNKNTNLNFYSDVLQILLYKALGTKEEIFKIGSEKYKIPFLNGDLFEPINNYDCENIKINLPNDLFKNENKTPEGDTGNGIINVFNRYNFTVREDEPLEKEVAIDPEMLGKVFERLLEVKDRKGGGKFYTPREIVHYMCKESLKNTIKNDYANAEILYTGNDDDIKKKFTIEELKDIKDKIISLKICDPACGSGAFLVGMMNEMILLITKIDNILGDKRKDDVRKKTKENESDFLEIKRGQKIIYNPDNELSIICEYLGNYNFKCIINNEKFGSYKVNDLTIFIKKFINAFNRNRGKSTIANLFSQGKIEDGESFNTIRSKRPLKYITDEKKNVLWEYKNYSTKGKTRVRDNEEDVGDNEAVTEMNYENYYYDMKKQIIQKCIYGVDIDKGAIEIAKLRLWLALVIEEQLLGDIKDTNTDVEKISPLPNLDYKIVKGDSLIGLDIESDSLLNNKELNELEKLKDKHFNETDIEEKYKLRNDIDKILISINNNVIDMKINSLKAKISNVKTTKKTKEKLYEEIAKLEGEKDNIIFDYEINFSEVFHRKSKGFDVVIGNPPYIQLQKNGGKLAKLYKQYNYKTLKSTGDIYVLFYEKGINILKDKGYLVYITSNKWMRAGYGDVLRDYLSKKNPVKIIDFSGFKVFDSATVDTNILIIQNNKNLNHTEAVQLKNNYKKGGDITEYFNNNKTILNNLLKDNWFIGNQTEINLKAKIERIGKPLKDWDVNIYRGILTGYNKAFIIDTETKEKLCKEDPKSAEIIKPILRGRDIKRYSYEWAGLWLIFIPWHFPLHKDKSITGSSEKAEKEFEKQYSAIFNHLLKHKEKLMKRNKAETGIRYEWYALQRCANTYYKEFEKEKIIFKAVGRNLTFSLLERDKFLTAPASFMTSNKNKYFLGFLCSNFTKYFIYNNGDKTGAGDVMLNIQSFEKIPIPPVTSSNSYIVNEIESLVDKILEAKKSDVNTDTTDLEKEIDKLVYELYELTEEEIKVVEDSVK